MAEIDSSGTGGESAEWFGSTDITRVSSRAMLDALIDGQHDLEVLADLAKSRRRSKIHEFAQVLTVGSRCQLGSRQHWWDGCIIGV